MTDHKQVDFRALRSAKDFLVCRRFGKRFVRRRIDVWASAFYRVLSLVPTMGSRKRPSFAY
jgi:hypothetical protein